MTDVDKYVDASAPVAAPEFWGPHMREAQLEVLRQQKIREWHHLISPAFFSTREKLKRNIAISLRNQGEAAVRRAQGQK
jgi:hypothetical protein